jgi:hypothetical protein
MSCLRDECCDDEHEYGDMEYARFTGTPHRQCANCLCITLDVDEEDE